MAFLGSARDKRLGETVQIVYIAKCPKQYRLWSRCCSYRGLGEAVSTDTSPRKGKYNMNCNVRQLLSAVILMGATVVMGSPSLSIATTVDSRSWSGDSCGSAGTAGSGSCFGATYSLVVDDAGDANPSTYSATLTVDIGTYTGGSSYTHIGAVDFKPGNVLAPVQLTAAPGPESDWQTLFTGGQAAGNCLNGAGGFLCSYDVGQNTNAPIQDNTVYTWSWNFSLNGAYAFGHFGVNYTVANDSCRQSLGQGQFATVADCLNDGQNISISAGGDRKVPEPSSMVLFGLGLIGASLFLRRYLA